MKRTEQEHVIIVAGGRGLRAGSELPKQFRLIGGRPVLMHTIEAFHRYNPEITIVVVLLWLYMSGQVLILGAGLSAALAQQKKNAAPPSGGEEEA